MYIHIYIYIFMFVYMYTYWRGSSLNYYMSASGDHNANWCFPSGKLLRSNLQGARYPVGDRGFIKNCGHVRDMVDF